MKKTIKGIGIFSICLLFLALIMPLLHISNAPILIVTGIVIFLLVELPLFLFYLNRSSQTKIGYNFLAFFSLFVFTIALFFSLQRFLVPVIIAAFLCILSGVFVIRFFYFEFKNERLSIRHFYFAHIFALFIILFILNVPIQLQAPDYTFHPVITDPAYQKGSGPTIFFDEAHNNIHTLNDRLLAVGRLLEDDGYKVRSLGKQNFTLSALRDCSILVIYNALNDKNIHNWTNPTFSAFSIEEMEILKKWVYEGGSLLLVVDHMPVSGASNDLAKEFGFRLFNGHAKSYPPKDNFFYRANGSLSDNIITNGLNQNEVLDSILSFDGSGFLIPKDAISILTFDSTYFQWEPESAWALNTVEPYSIQGYSQGAFKDYGKGKIAIFGEAMMFTAQLGAGLSWIKIGMNSEKCPDNYQLLLNTIHWLDGKMD